MSSSSPFKVSVSGPLYDSEHVAVVNVRRDFCDKVTDKDEFVGKLRDTSRFPQYLSEVRDEIARGRASSSAYLLDHSDIDRRSSRRTINLAMAST